MTYPSSNFDSDRILRQRFHIEEYGADLIYIKDEDNEVVDAQSYLPMPSTPLSEESFLNRRVFQDTVIFPLDIPHLQSLQNNDTQLLHLIKDKRSCDKYKNRFVSGVNLWTMNNKVYVAKECRQPLITWYHENLHHSGPQRTSSTLRQHFNWPGAVEDIKRHIIKSPICQKSRITGRKKYSKIPLIKDLQDVPPFHTIHLDMIGPWKVKFLRGQKKISTNIQALTIVDKGSTW